jgi:hypothetical protein
MSHTFWIDSLEQREKNVLEQMLDQFLSNAWEQASDPNVSISRELEDQCDIAEDWWLQLTGSRWHK